MMADLKISSRKFLIKNLNLILINLILPMNTD